MSSSSRGDWSLGKPKATKSDQHTSDDPLPCHDSVVLAKTSVPSQIGPTA